MSISLVAASAGACVLTVVPPHTAADSIDQAYLSRCLKGLGQPCLGAQNVAFPVGRENAESAFGVLNSLWRERTKVQIVSGRGTSDDEPWVLKDARYIFDGAFGVDFVFAKTNARERAV